MSTHPFTPSEYELRATTNSAVAYPFAMTDRDLRLDFLRGLVMIILISVHMDYYSLFGMFAWGRIGMVSSAEGFVALSGIVLGVVYRKRLAVHPFYYIIGKLWSRSFQLYRTMVFVILSIALLRIMPFVNVFEVTHWVNPGARHLIYPLYPAENTSWFELISQAFLLKIGPHQFQVIGLYVMLIALAPIVLYYLHKRQTILLLALSWLIYGINQIFHYQLTGARFEFAFPILTWQLLFINGMAIGFQQERLTKYLLSEKNRKLIFAIILLCLGFTFLALNHPNPIYWPWQTFSYIDAGSYKFMYQMWFEKNSLGLGRVINNALLFIALYYLLSQYWQPIYKTIGWLLVPLGQASFYVFVLHLYFIVLLSNTPLPNYDSFIVNTFIHAATILTIWMMVKRRVLFNIIPR